ncbi:MAG: AAA family ATPase [Thermoleophilia bacterium]|nr:AAA family ATPase [Thermoleophilia bacterium]
MAAEAQAIGSLPHAEASQELARGWRRLTRATTIVALMTAPALVVWFTQQNHWSWLRSILVALAIVAVFRGFSDLLLRRLIPWPSLFGVESAELREADVLGRRRAWFWRFWFKIATFLAIVVTITWWARGGTWLGQLGFLASALGSLVTNPTFLIQMVFVTFLFIANFAIMFGPLLLMNLSQMQSFEPGDAEWGVKLDHVRGQEEAKEEVRRVVDIWQSGEAFERAGGKRERGLLLFGPPGTGKTMLAKAIATGFNSPFISMPGSGFAATFIGIDAIVVRLLARRAKKLARKWGGQCIVFIDEIDAVGMRRQALGSGASAPAFQPLRTGADLEELLFFGPNGARNPSGDLILETRAWRERLFAQRAPVTLGVPSGLYMRLGQVYNFMFPGGMGMGSLALNQLLVVMDGIDNPPFLRRTFTSKLNTLLDATFVIPRRLGRAKLRIPAARPRGDQIYFIGATNVPIDRLDPALIRPGRMGRHVWFRTPTKNDRLDILDLYIGKVAHDPELDTPTRRDEIARIMSGYSPAMIEQATSMALTLAHHTGRTSFGWDDLVEAVTTLDAGTAMAWEYVDHERRAVAIHEAGHAACGHLFMEGRESTRLTIKRRGDTGGHHWMIQTEERMFRFQHERFNDLVWGLGAMAAERVFYGENTEGVGGDVFMVTANAAQMVGGAAMGPVPFTATPREGQTDEQARADVLRRFERIGAQIMNRSGGGGPFAADPIASVLSDPAKRAVATQLLGQAYVFAHNVVTVNRESIKGIASALEERREIMGDELLELLRAAGLQKPALDFADAAIWPPLEFSATVSRDQPTGGQSEAPGNPPGADA